jgi:hypothetical protein
LKGGGQLVTNITKTWNGEQIRGMVTGLGSVSGCPRPTQRQRQRGVYKYKCMQVSYRYAPINRCTIGSSCSVSSQVERGLCEHVQPYICVDSDDGGLLPRLFQGALGNEGVCSVGFWEDTLVLFLGRWYREWEEKAPRSMEFELCSLHVTSQTDQIYVFMSCIMSYIIKAVSVVADATTYMCWFCVWGGHGTGVSQTGCKRLGSATRRVSFYVSLVGGGLRLSGPSSGNNGGVRVYRRVIFGK